MLFNAISTTTTLFLVMTILKDVSSLPLDSDPATSTNELQNSTTIRSARDTSPYHTSHPRLAAEFFDQCPDSSFDPKHKQNADINDYILDSCQQVDPPGDTMRVHWDAGFNTITLYKDKNCTEKMDYWYRSKEGEGSGETCLVVHFWNPKSRHTKKMLSFRGTVETHKNCNAGQCIG